MLTSQTIPSLRPLHIHATANNVFASSATSSLQLRRPIQIRAFRFGIWSSYLDSADDRELRRRFRTLRLKYPHIINTKSPWHENPLPQEPVVAFQRAAARYWGLATAGCSSRRVNQDELGTRAGATPRTSNRPFGTDPNSPRTSSRDVKPRSEMEMRFGRHRVDANTRMPESHEAVQSKTDSIEGKDYVIDPITNRKVLKREQERVLIDFEPLASTINTWRKRPFNPLNPEHPVNIDDKPPASELEKYAENKFDDWPVTGVQSSADSTESSGHPRTTSYVFDNSELKNEEYSLNHLPLDDPIEDYSDLQKDQSAPPDNLPGESINGSKRRGFDGVGPQSISHPDSSSQSSSEPDQLQSELQKYGPYMYDESSSKHADAQEIKDLAKYRCRAPREPEVAKEPSTVYDDLYKYAPTTFDDIKDEDQPFQRYGDLEKYKAFRLQNLDTSVPLERDIVAESLKEYETKEQDGGVPSVSTHVNEFPKKIPKMKLPERHVFSEHYSGQTEAETLCQDNTSSLNPSGQASEFHEAELTLKDNLRAPHGREELARSAGDISSEVPFSTKEEGTSQLAQDRPSKSPRLESTLNRRLSAMKGNRSGGVFGADLYSKEPQGLETSFFEECGGKSTMPLYKRTYGSEPRQGASESKASADTKAQESLDGLSNLYYDRDPEIDGIPPSISTDSIRNSKTTQPDEPTVYKILAYDPTTQTVNVAETTSVVPDLASPLSPTEVLLRLSNPTKFFTYFGPLQAEGFEIVSGGGDRLVFRQVRPAKAAGQGGPTYVNPIDMMGRSAAVPNAAAFVSPTGFVNYDMPGVEEPAEPPFRSNIDVRREEPVFSGQKSSSRDKENKKSKKSRMNVGGRIILGGAWVAGISYALGVVSEYFHTGGADGKGPTGF
ncbi:hypothetical protein GQX73_g6049 [Xylaria multiplex]|uniref:Uncharacterized protein n=1 Tax=Xylaria multiplex TaxID=323545 RepID=A0A7C8IML7_9PEZI|nr:hypothetical protein GQX73_g6049 [Xylaria multiplex]